MYTGVLKESAALTKKPKILMQKKNTTYCWGRNGRVLFLLGIPILCHKNIRKFKLFSGLNFFLKTY